MWKARASIWVGLVDPLHFKNSINLKPWYSKMDGIAWCYDLFKNEVDDVRGLTLNQCDVRTCAYVMLVMSGMGGPIHTHKIWNKPWHINTIHANGFELFWWRQPCERSRTFAWGWWVHWSTCVLLRWLCWWSEVEWGGTSSIPIFQFG